MPSNDKQRKCCNPGRSRAPWRQQRRLQQQAAPGAAYIHAPDAAGPRPARRAWTAAAASIP
eukprot:1220784-Pyramimonas_sp.AAC.1